MSTGLRREAEDALSGGSLAERAQSLPARGVTAVVAPVRRRVRRTTRSWSTTPGRLSLISGGLVVLIVVAGLGAAAAVSLRADATAELVERHEPTMATIQDVYRALSDADATAAMAFLAAGDESDELLTRYEDDIALAGPSLGLTGFDPTADQVAARHIGVVGRQLPVYTGLVETARANNRQGIPIGAAYLRQASHLMRSEILPAAEQLYRIQRERVTGAQESAAGLPYLATALVAVAVVGLVLAQVHVRRRAKRRFNIGLVVASIAIALGVAWSGFALAVQSTLVNAGQRDGTDQVDLLVESRIAALQARADELLVLVARGAGGAYAEGFDTLTAQFAGDDGTGGWLGEAGDTAEGGLADQIEDAMRNAGMWLRAHARVRQLDDDGEHAAAVDLAIDPDNDQSTATAFTQLDDALAKAIWTGRQDFVEATVTGQRALTLLAPGWLVLAAIAVAGVVAGIRQRLREYR